MPGEPDGAPCVPRMTNAMPARRLPLLLLALLLLGLMAVALLLALDGQSPAALLPGATDRGSDAGAATDTGGADSLRGRDERRGRRAGRISGDVRVLRSRAPAAGRVVTLTLEDGDIRQATTDAQGGFAFGDVPPDRPLTLRVDGDDHAPVVRPGIFVRPGQRLDVGTLWLADGVRVDVEVVSFDGRALSGATVRAFAQGPGTSAFDAPRDPPPVALAHAGPDGVATFAGLPPGLWTFTAECGGYARRGLTGAEVREGVVEETFRLALEKGYRLDGRVLDAAGAPVAGAPVLAIRRTLVSDATTAPLALRTVTDRDGRFVFAALPAADVVLWSGWPGGRLAVLAAVRLPGVTSLDLVLLRGGRLEGQVTRASDGAPVDDAEVTVSMQVLGSFVLGFELRTDHDGRYALDLPMPGTVTQVSASQRGFLTRWREGDGTVVPTGALVTIDLALEPGGRITGRVTAPHGPVVGATVGATNSGWYHETTSDREGRFELRGLPLERLFVTADLWGHTMPDRPDDPDRALATGTAPERYVADLAAASEAEIEIELVPGPTLKGRVETHDGAPAGGALVEVPWGTVAARAGPDGAFALGPMGPGTSRVTAAAADGSAHGDADVEIPADGSEPAAVTIRLGAPLRVRGRLISAAGAALEGAYVQIEAWDGELDDPVQDEWSWLELPRLPVNGDGTFDHPVDARTGAFFVRGGALGHRRARSGRLALSTAQPEVVVELTLDAGETFTGRVVDADGAPVPGAWVAAVPVPPGTDPYRVGYPGAWGPPIVTVAGRDGGFRVAGLDAGPHAVRAWAAGYLPDAHVVDVPAGSGRTFEIVAALTIAGRVTFSDGAPAPGVRVTAMHADGGGYGEARTDSDGRFEVAGLAGGTYRIEVAPTSGGGANVLPRAVDGVPAGTHDVHVEVERGRTVSGVVLDDRGAPVAGATVSVSQDDERYAETVTDPRGAFSLGGLAAGRCTLQVNADVLEGTGKFGTTAAAGDDGITIRLPAPARVSGTVVGPSGAPLAGHALRLIPVEGSGGLADDIWQREVVLAADGSFDVAVSPATRYRAVLPEHDHLTLPADAQIAAGDRGVRLLAVSGATVRGRAVDADGNGVASAEIRATGPETERRAATEADGSFELTGLHAGQTVELWAAGSSWTTPSGTTTSVPADGVTLRLARLGSVGGRVVAADGTSAGSVLVTLAPVTGGNTWMTRTDDAGRFRMDGLPAGEYRVHVAGGANGDLVPCGSISTDTLDAEIRYAPR